MGRQRRKYAYSDLYIDDVMGNVGELFQFADIEYEVPLSGLLNKWLPSVYCHGIEQGIPHYMVGMTGREVAMDLFGSNDTKLQWAPALEEYWIGWAAAYLQWYCNISFKHLFEIISLDRFYMMYPAYHCMDLSHLDIFADEEILPHIGEICIWNDGNCYFKKQEC